MAWVVGAAATRTHVFSAAVANLVPLSVPPILSRSPLRMPIVVRSIVAANSPVDDASRPPASPSNPTTLMRAFAGGADSSASPGVPARTMVVAVEDATLNVPLFPALVKPVVLTSMPALNDAPPASTAMVFVDAETPVIWLSAVGPLSFDGGRVQLLMKAPAIRSSWMTWHSSSASTRGMNTFGPANR